MSTDFRGPAALRLDDGEIPVSVRMSARFEPVEGRFRWAGRTGPDADLLRLVSGGLRTAVLVVEERETVVKLGEPDPWGGVRLSGTGTPPWFEADDGLGGDRGFEGDRALEGDRGFGGDRG